MTLRQLVRIIGYVLGLKQRRRIRFVRATGPKLGGSRTASLPPVVQRFEDGTTFDASNFGAVDVPASSPPSGGLYDAKTRFSSAPLDPLRRSGRR